jgi:hypothetical protein
MVSMRKRGPTAYRLPAITNVAAALDAIPMRTLRACRETTSGASNSRYRAATAVTRSRRIACDERPWESVATRRIVVLPGCRP